MADQSSNSCRLSKLAKLTRYLDPVARAAALTGIDVVALVGEEEIYPLVRLWVKPSNTNAVCSSRECIWDLVTVPIPIGGQKGLAFSFIPYTCIVPLCRRALGDIRRLATAFTLCRV
jgi:hypothetical protein